MFDPLSQNLYTEKNIELFVNNDEHHAVIAKVAYAFSSPERIKILKSFLWMPKTLSDVAKELFDPRSFPTLSEKEAKSGNGCILL